MAGLLQVGEKEARGGTWPPGLAICFNYQEICQYLHTEGPVVRLHLVNTAQSLLSFSICKKGVSPSSASLRSSDSAGLSCSLAVK